MDNTPSPTARMRRALRVGVVIAAGSLLVACTSGGDPSSAGETIKVGQITTISGGYPFGDVVAGTQAYIDMLNENGGVAGHPVELIADDDKGEAAQASQLARKLIQQDGVIAMVGNTSIADCSANMEMYIANDVPVIGGGTHSTCFESPVWAAVNAGPPIGHVVMWDYIVNNLDGRNKVVCGIDQNDPGSIDYMEQLRAEFEAENDFEFKYVTYTNDSTQNPTPAVTNAKNEGCEIIAMSTVASNYIAFIQAAAAVGLDATFITGAAYDESLPSTLGAVGEPGALGPQSQGIFVISELAPVTDAHPNVQQFTEAMADAGIEANFWSQIGWLSALVFFTALEEGSDEFDITTSAGALEALRAMSPIETGFAAGTMLFGEGDRHALNLGGRVLVIEEGEWQLAPGQPDDWTIVGEISPFEG